MKLGRIEVSGITRIVFNREFVWERKEYFGLVEPIWVKIAEDGSWGYFSCSIREPKEIRDMLDYMLGNPAYRMWVHGDTLNIVKEV